MFQKVKPIKALMHKYFCTIRHVIIQSGCMHYFYNMIAKLIKQCVGMIHQGNNANIEVIQNNSIHKGSYDNGILEW